MAALYRIAKEKYNTVAAEIIHPKLCCRKVNIEGRSFCRHLITCLGRVKIRSAPGFLFLIADQSALYARYKRRITCGMSITIAEKAHKMAQAYYLFF